MIPPIEMTGFENFAKLIINIAKVILLEGIIK